MFLQQLNGLKAWPEQCRHECGYEAWLAAGHPRYGFPDTEVQGPDVKSEQAIAVASDQLPGADMQHTGFIPPSGKLCVQWLPQASVLINSFKEPDI